MSLSALLQATRNRLQTELGIDSYQCNIMPDEKCPPIAGDEFISIFGDSWSPLDEDLAVGIDETYGMVCAVTRRIRHIPKDRIGSDVYVETTASMEARLREIIGLVHLNYDLITNANDIINDVHGIVEPFRWKGGDSSPRWVGPEHFYIQDPESTVAGLLMTVTFGDARRPQVLASYDSGA